MINSVLRTPASKRAVSRIRVTLYQRRALGVFSLERLFADVRVALPADIDATVAVSRFASRGFFRRVYNMIEATLRQGEVNHITGDVHFLALLLRKRKTLLTIQDLGSVHRLKGVRRALLHLIWFRLPTMRAAVVSVTSNATREDLCRCVRLDPGKLRVIPACVSEAFIPAAKEFNASKPLILAVGTGANKNLEREAEALGGIPCHLRVIGRADASPAGCS